MEKYVSLLWSQLLECFRWLPINCSVFPQDKIYVLSLLGKPFGHFHSSLYLKLIGPLSLQLWQIAHLSLMLQNIWHLPTDSRTLENTQFIPTSQEEKQTQRH